MSSPVPILSSPKGPHAMVGIGKMLSLPTLTAIERVEAIYLDKISATLSTSYNSYSKEEEELKKLQKMISIAEHVIASSNRCSPLPQSPIRLPQGWTNSPSK